MIYTSYFARLSQLRKSGILPISIARYNPRWFNGPRIIELAPTSAMLHMDADQYDKLYYEILANLRPEDIVAKINSISKGQAALLCYEKDPLQCHRSMVSDWLKKAGYECDEWQTRKEIVAGSQMNMGSLGRP